jgi:hypothetical protein
VTVLPRWRTYRAASEVDRVDFVLLSREISGDSDETTNPIQRGMTQVGLLELPTPENGDFRSQRKGSRFFMKSLLVFIVLAAMAAAQAPSGVRSLGEIQKIYVDRMPDGLDRCIRLEITKQFKGKLAVVPQPEQADAIMVVAETTRIGGEPVTTDRRVGLLDLTNGSISVLDKAGKLVLWSSEVHDRSIWWGATKRGGAQKVADRLVHELKIAIERSSRRPS